MNYLMPDQEPEEKFTKEELKEISDWSATQGFLWGMACMLVLFGLFFVFVK